MLHQGTLQTVRKTVVVVDHRTVNPCHRNTCLAETALLGQEEGRIEVAMVAGELALLPVAVEAPVGS